MLSITLTLFGGLGLKATTEIPTEKQTVYESGLMAFILVGINVGVVLLSAYQVFLTFRKGPANSQTKLQRKMCVKMFDMALVKNQSAVVQACNEISPDNSSDLAPVLIEGLREMARLLPIALDTLDNLGDILTDLKEMSSFSDAMDVMDQLLKVAAKVLGPPRMKKLFQPYCTVLADEIRSLLSDMGASEEICETFAEIVPNLAMYLVVTGVKGFMKQMMAITSVNNLADLATVMSQMAASVNEKMVEGKLGD